MTRTGASIVLLAFACVGCGGSAAGPRDGSGGVDAPVSADLRHDAVRHDAPRDAAPDGVRPDTSDLPDLVPPGDTPDGRTDARPDGADAPETSAPDADARDVRDAGDAADADAGPPPVPCATREECLAAMPYLAVCESVDCVGGACVIASIPGCCAFDAACHDWDACTRDRCDPYAHVCVNDVLDPATCCAGEWRLAEGFEEGLSDWTVRAAEDARATWRLVDAPVASGQGAVVFNDPRSATYDTGFHEQGDLVGPWIDVPAQAERPIFRFDLDLVTEWQWFTDEWVDPYPLLYDRLQLLVDDGARETEVWSSYSVDVRGSTCAIATGCTFRTFEVDFSAFRARRVRPVFRFDTGDHVDNAYLGPVLDNVGLILACGAAAECLASTDCDDMDPCTDDRCESGTCTHAPNYQPGCCYDYDRASWQFDPFSLSGFEVDPPEPLVRWHVTEERALTPPASLRFGHIGNRTFNDPGVPVHGIATSAQVPLPYWTPLRMELAVWVDVEPYDPTAPERDLFRVIIQTMDGSQTVVWDRSLLLPGEEETWVPVQVSLDAFAGMTIFVKLQFSSGDAEDNEGEGVYVDMIRIVRGC